MLTRPRLLLHLEGAGLVVLALCFYRANHFPWWLFAVLFLAPDLCMLGYLLNARWGAAIYNLAHITAGPILLVLIGYLTARPLISYGLIWSAHIGFDRLLGYGLKYPTQFRDTHLQHL